MPLPFFGVPCLPLAAVAMCLCASSLHSTCPHCLVNPSYNGHIKLRRRAGTRLSISCAKPKTHEQNWVA